jgi:hypothetical protein
MRLRVFRVLTIHRSRFAAICGLAAVAFFAAAVQAASAATPLDGERLTGAGPSTGNTLYKNGNCYIWWGGMGFSISGTASGPYPGSFSETGSFSLPLNLKTGLRVYKFNATFTITSGTTNIMGTLSASLTFNAPIICSAGHVTGIHLGGIGVGYTATINGQTYQGPADVGGTLYTAAGAQDTIWETISSPPPPPTNGDIYGTVVDSRTGAPIGGICVRAYNSSGSVVASTQTVSSGAYALLGVPPGTEPTGSVKVGFSTGCGASNYLPQYYNAQPSLASANPVTVTAGVTTSGINAAMVAGAGGQITGTVLSRAASRPLEGICAQATNAAAVWSRRRRRAQPTPTR